MALIVDGKLENCNGYVKDIFDKLFFGDYLDPNECL